MKSKKEKLEAQLKKLEEKEKKKQEVPKPPKEITLKPEKKLPFDKKTLKKHLVAKHLKAYAEPILIDGKKTFQPTEEEIELYKKDLEKSSIKELMRMRVMRDYNLKLDIGDRLKSINKKKFSVVTIFNDNQTTDTGVCHSYDRTFTRAGMTYIIMTERGRYDPEFKMMHFYYFANNPFPIEFNKTKMPEAVADGKLMDDIIEMKVIEALANIDMDKKITFLVFAAICNLAMNLISIIILMKASGILK